AGYGLARASDPVSRLADVAVHCPPRRRYRGRWENGRLGTIAHRRLGSGREADLPGSEAPAAWLCWLRGGSAAQLRRVCAHNHQDVVTLARLLLRLVRAHDASPELSGPPHRRGTAPGSAHPGRGFTP